MAKKNKTKNQTKVSNAVKLYVKKALDKDEEDKVHWIEDANVITGSGTWDFYLLNGMINGPQQGERLGNEIHCKYLKLRINLVPNSIIVNPTMVRILILRDKQANGVFPNPISGNGGLFYNSLGQSQTIALYQQETLSNRYVILYDKVIEMHNSGGATDQSQWEFIKINKKLGFKTHYGLSNGATNTVADIATNSLILMVGSVNAGVANLDFQSSLYFEDA